MRYHFDLTITTIYFLFYFFHWRHNYLFNNLLFITIIIFSYLQPVSVCCWPTGCAARCTVLVSDAQPRPNISISGVGWGGGKAGKAALSAN